MTERGADPLRTWHHGDFGLEDMLEAKGSGCHHVSVCLPARDEAATIGPIVEVLCQELVDRWSLVDEVLVVDDGSVDDTARVAGAAGATVVSADDILEECGPGHGKGDVLWKSLHAAKGDLLLFCDADVRHFGPHFATGLLGPLLLHDDVGFVKGLYRRPVDGAPDGGGRVTELVARPLLAALFPHLAPVVQPLAGEYAGRRQVLEQVPFVQGYGVELGLLIDVAARFGPSAIAQVDLGSRVHRNRTLSELAPQASDVLRTALARAGVLEEDGRVAERPPIIAVPAYRRRG